MWVSDAACLAAQANSAADVPRNAPDMTSDVADMAGGVQIEDAEESAWPFIQTYDLDNYGDFDICYVNGAGGECVSVSYDDDVNQSLTADRSLYPPGASVHLTIFDQMLNLDPTAVDIWTFDFSANTPSYGEFTDGSATASDATDLTANNLATLGYDDGGIFKMTENSVLDVQNNADFTAQDTATDISFIESSWNTGEFINTDDADKSNLIIAKSANRGEVGTIDYNDDAQSIQVGYTTASVSFDAAAVGDEWNSGEELPLLLVDNDLNLNSASDEDLTVANDRPTIPTITIGSPGYLTASPWITIGRSATGNSTTLTLDAQSHIASNDDGVGTITTVADGGTDAEGIEIGTGILGTDFETLARTIDADADDIISDETRGIMVMQYDFRQIAADVCGANDPTSSSYVAHVDALNIVLRDDDSRQFSLLSQVQQGEINIDQYFTSDIDNLDDGEIVVEIGCRTGTGATYNSMNDSTYFLSLIHI